MMIFPRHERAWINVGTEFSVSALPERGAETKTQNPDFSGFISFFW